MQPRASFFPKQNDATGYGHLVASRSFIPTSLVKFARSPPGAKHLRGGVLGIAMSRRMTV
jgi:hypothetical protein